MPVVWPELIVAVVTFRREERLIDVLGTLERQDTIPGLLMIVDNTHDLSAAKQVSAFQKRSAISTEYLPLHRNLGPAGGYAAAIDRAIRAPSVHRWLMCHDDDHAFEPGDIGTMREFVEKTSHLSPTAVGFRGVRYSRALGQPYRVAREEVDSRPWVEVDGITGLGAPTYDLTKLAEHHLNFDPDMFFGFEELDFGLRIRRSGGRLLTHSRRDLELRNDLGQLDLKPFEFESGKIVAAWRSYFSHRNRLILAKREATVGAILRLLVRSLAKSVRELVRGSPARAYATLVGARDGLFGRRPSKRYIVS